MNTGPSADPREHRPEGPAPAVRRGQAASAAPAEPGRRREPVPRLGEHRGEPERDEQAATHPPPHRGRHVDQRRGRPQGEREHEHRGAERGRHHDGPAHGIRVGGTGDRPTHDDRQEGQGTGGQGRQGSRDEGPEEGQRHVRPSSRGSRGRPPSRSTSPARRPRGRPARSVCCVVTPYFLRSSFSLSKSTLTRVRPRGDAVARDGLLRRPAGGAPGRVEEVDDLGARPRVDLVRVLRLGRGRRRRWPRAAAGVAGACEELGAAVGVADPAGDVAATGGAPVSVAEPHPASRRARATVTAVVTGRAWGRGRIGCSSGRRGLESKPTTGRRSSASTTTSHPGKQLGPPRGRREPVPRRPFPDPCAPAAPARASPQRRRPEGPWRSALTCSSSAPAPTPTRPPRARATAASTPTSSGGR